MIEENRMFFFSKKKTGREQNVTSVWLKNAYLANPLWLVLNARAPHQCAASLPSN
jgi:hypothetical protein